MTEAPPEDGRGPVVALAGRRIDASGAEVRRFPLENRELVRERIRDFLVSHRASALVSSAACGADLLALDVAGELGVPRRVVLPFDAGRFRATSVSDRPGDWREMYDRVLAAVEAERGTVVLDQAPGDSAYARANVRIASEAIKLANQMGTGTLGVIVWDGGPRGPDDLTAQFRRAAQEQGMEVRNLSTI